MFALWALMGLEAKKICPSTIDWTASCTPVVVVHVGVAPLCRGELAVARVGGGPHLEGGPVRWGGGARGRPAPPAHRFRVGAAGQFYW